MLKIFFHFCIMTIVWWIKFRKILPALWHYCVMVGWTILYYVCAISALFSFIKKHSIFKILLLRSSALLYLSLWSPNIFFLLKFVKNLCCTHLCNYSNILSWWLDLLSIYLCLCKSLVHVSYMPLLMSNVMSRKLSTLFDGNF